MSDAVFRAKAPGIMNLLMADFQLDVESAAAILGNLGHESGGFRFLQEKQPLIPGSAGGYGWAQWTGPRRRAYEAYCERNGFDPASDTANYKFLFVELSGSERAAIPAVKNAAGLDAKVRAFEMAFERAGIKHYESRLEWANRALEAYRANPGGTIEVQHGGEQVVEPKEVKPDKDDLIWQLIRAAMPILLARLSGQPQPAAPPPPDSKVTTDRATDMRSAILGIAGSLGLAGTGAIEPNTGILAAAASAAVGAFGLPAPVVRIASALGSSLFGMLRNASKPK